MIAIVRVATPDPPGPLAENCTVSDVTLAHGTFRFTVPVGGPPGNVSGWLECTATLVAFCVAQETATFPPPAAGHVKEDGTDTEVNVGSSGIVIPVCAGAGAGAAAPEGFVVVVVVAEPPLGATPPPALFVVDVAPGVPAAAAVVVV